MMHDMMGLSKCGERYVLIFKRFIFFFVLTVAMSQDVADSLQVQLEAKGEWQSYYVGNEKSGFDFVSVDGEVDSLFFTGDQSIEPWVICLLYTSPSPRDS